MRTDDIWPLGDHPHAYWSGYFTSRPALKRQVRFATNLLVAARQLEVVSNLSAAQVGHATERRSPVLFARRVDTHTLLPVSYDVTVSQWKTLTHRGMAHQSGQGQCKITARTA